MKRSHCLAALAAASALASCRAFSSPGDYALYRAYRYEASGPERLAAGSRYMAQYPHGAFSREVGGEVNAREEDFWADHRSSPDQLREYVAAFPQGSHGEEARTRLEVFESRRRQQEEERRTQEAAANEQRTQELREATVRQRLWARGLYNRWIRVFGGLNGWGQSFGPIVQANPDFSAQFENDPPQCRASHCRKNYTLDFSIPVPGRSAYPRRLAATLDMVRVGAERQVNQALVTAHNRGLTQWWELENQEAVEPTDAAARETAVRWAMDQLRAAVVASFPGARETPSELYGPPPEAVMQGVEEDENAAPEAVDPNACLVPSQPLGTRWTAVVGCQGATSAQVTANPQAVEAHAHSLTADEPVVTPHACLRFDAYAAIEGEGMSTDEGLAISLIPACALRRGGPATRPGVRPPARPAAPAARPAAARPAAARPAAARPAASPAAPQ